mmetsp:Transcript_98287/g.275172  ORF Transcript_98287/g.275172 Transcript_98287/m.275172 type:complete len:154 (-) Transcript_98287:195-656(-)
MPGVHGQFSRSAPLQIPARDGFAEFYGYGSAGDSMKVVRSDDAFARFFGYSTADEVVPTMGVAHLPDRDPMSPTRSDPMHSTRSCRDATETSLQMVQSGIHERKMQLRVMQGDAAQQVRSEIEQLWMQHARLEEAMVSLGKELEGSNDERSRR